MEKQVLKVEKVREEMQVKMDHKVLRDNQVQPDATETEGNRGRQGHEAFK